jgi:hypothetical protein
MQARDTRVNGLSKEIQGCRDVCLGSAGSAEGSAGRFRGTAGRGRGRLLPGGGETPGESCPRGRRWILVLSSARAYPPPFRGVFSRDWQRPEIRDYRKNVFCAFSGKMQSRDGAGKAENILFK